MKELEGTDKDGLKCPESGILSLLVIGRIESGLDHLDVPVAELLPEKIVNFLNSDTEFETVHVIGHILNKSIES